MGHIGGLEATPEMSETPGHPGFHTICSTYVREGGVVRVNAGHLELDPTIAPPPRSLDLVKHQNRRRAHPARHAWCGRLTAAKPLGESAGISRFKSEAAFARHAGIAPIPVWSGPTAGRVRMTRSGNRQLNAAIHRIVITQTRLDGLGKIYYEKKAEGMTTPKPCGVSNDDSRASSFHLTTDHQARQQPVPAFLPAAA
jgi:hypothetical protein